MDAGWWCQFSFSRWKKGASVTCKQKLQLYKTRQGKICRWNNFSIKLGMVIHVCHVALKKIWLKDVFKANLDYTVSLQDGVTRGPGLPLPFDSTDHLTTLSHWGDTRRPGGEPGHHNETRPLLMPCCDIVYVTCIWVFVPNLQYRVNTLGILWTISRVKKTFYYSL